MMIHRVTDQPRLQVLVDLISGYTLWPKVSIHLPNQDAELEGQRYRVHIVGWSPLVLD
jgi:hypothetical protein